MGALHNVVWVTPVEFCVFCNYKAQELDINQNTENRVYPSKTKTV